MWLGFTFCLCSYQRLYQVLTRLCSKNHHIKQGCSLFLDRTLWNRIDTDGLVKANNFKFCFKSSKSLISQLQLLNWNRNATCVLPILINNWKQHDIIWSKIRPKNDQVISEFVQRCPPSKGRKLSSHPLKQFNSWAFKLHLNDSFGSVDFSPGAILSWFIFGQNDRPWNHTNFSVCVLCSAFGFHKKYNAFELFSRL